METLPEATRPRLNLDAFVADFASFHARFASLFARSEPRRKAEQYLRTQMGPVERRNGWQMAEAMGDARPDAVQRLLYHANWSARQACDRLADFIVEQFGDPEGIGVVDETGFVKKGTASVGVQRQYSGTAGKVENCQIGVFLGYTSARGHVLLDRHLYLPQSWCEDPGRRRRAHVPSAVRFHTKPYLALRMLRRAWRRGVPMAWVTGDETYGDDPKFRAGVEAAGRLYVLAVASITPVWTTPPEVVRPPVDARALRGRPRTRPRLAPHAPKPHTVAQVVASWSEGQWHRFAAQQGDKGPVTYDWACARVIESRHRLPAGEHWLLARRSVTDPSEIAYYLSNAGAATTLPMLAWVASRRYTIEQCFEEAKDDVGLDQYEVRTWPSWHRHVTLTMMALAWLASVHAKLTEPASSLAREAGVDDAESTPAAPPAARGKKAA
jgi:SRSO17 transposase